MKVSVSRWHYFPGYFIGALSIAGAVSLVLFGWLSFAFISLAGGFVFILLCEVLIRQTSLRIGPKSLVLYAVTTTRVPYRKMTGVTAHQSRLQRWLRFGDLRVKVDDKVLDLEGVRDPSAAELMIRRKQLEAKRR